MVSIATIGLILILNTTMVLVTTTVLMLSSGQILKEVKNAKRP